MSEAALSIIAKSYKHPRVNEWVSVDKQHKVDNTMDTIQHLKQKKKVWPFWVWQCAPIIATLESLNHQDDEFWSSLGYIAGIKTALTA